MAKTKRNTKTSKRTTQDATEIRRIYVEELPDLNRYWYAGGFDRLRSLLGVLDCGPEQWPANKLLSLEGIWQPNNWSMDLAPICENRNATELRPEDQVGLGDFVWAGNGNSLGELLTFAGLRRFAREVVEQRDSFSEQFPCDRVLFLPYVMPSDPSPRELADTPALATDALAIARLGKLPIYILDASFQVATGTAARSARSGTASDGSNRATRRHRFSSELPPYLFKPIGKGKKSTYLKKLVDGREAFVCLDQIDTATREGKLKSWAGVMGTELLDTFKRGSIFLADVDKTVKSLDAEKLSKKQRKDKLPCLFVDQPDDISRVRSADDLRLAAEVANEYCTALLTTSGQSEYDFSPWAVPSLNERCRKRLGSGSSFLSVGHYRLPVSEGLYDSSKAQHESLAGLASLFALGRSSIDTDTVIPTDVFPPFGDGGESLPATDSQFLPGATIITLTFGFRLGVWRESAQAGGSNFADEPIVAGTFIFLRNFPEPPTKEVSSAERSADLEDALAKDSEDLKVFAKHFLEGFADSARNKATALNGRRSQEAAERVARKTENLSILNRILYMRRLDFGRDIVRDIRREVEGRSILGYRDQHWLHTELDKVLLRASENFVGAASGKPSDDDVALVAGAADRAATKDSRTGTKTGSPASIERSRSGSADEIGSPFPLDWALYFAMEYDDISQRTGNFDAESTAAKARWAVIGESLRTSADGGHVKSEAFRLMLNDRDQNHLRLFLRGEAGADEGVSNRRVSVELYTKDDGGNDWTLRFGRAKNPEDQRWPSFARHERVAKVLGRLGEDSKARVAYVVDVTLGFAEVEIGVGPRRVILVGLADPEHELTAREDYHDMTVFANRYWELTHSALVEEFGLLSKEESKTRQADIARLNRHLYREAISSVERDLSGSLRRTANFADAWTQIRRTILDGFTISVSQKPERASMEVFPFDRVLFFPLEDHGTDELTLWQAVFLCSACQRAHDSAPSGGIGGPTGKGGRRACAPVTWTDSHTCATGRTDRVFDESLRDHSKKWLWYPSHWKEGSAAPVPASQLEHLATWVANRWHYVRASRVLLEELRDDDRQLAAIWGVQRRAEANYVRSILNRYFFLKYFYRRQKQKVKNAVKRAAPLLEPYLERPFEKDFGGDDEQVEDEIRKWMLGLPEEERRSRSGLTPGVVGASAEVLSIRKGGKQSAEDERTFPGFRAFMQSYARDLADDSLSIRSDKRQAAHTWAFPFVKEVVAKAQTPQLRTPEEATLFTVFVDFGSELGDSALRGMFMLVRDEDLVEKRAVGSGDSARSQSLEYIVEDVDDLENYARTYFGRAQQFVRNEKFGERLTTNLTQAMAITRHWYTANLPVLGREFHAQHSDQETEHDTVDIIEGVIRALAEQVEDDSGNAIPMENFPFDRAILFPAQVLASNALWQDLQQEIKKPDTGKKEALAAINAAVEDARRRSLDWKITKDDASQGLEPNGVEPSDGPAQSLSPSEMVSIPVLSRTAHYFEATFECPTCDAVNTLLMLKEPTDQGEAGASQGPTAAGRGRNWSCSECDSPFVRDTWKKALGEDRIEIDIARQTDARVLPRWGDDWLSREIDIKTPLTMAVFIPLLERVLGGSLPSEGLKELGFRALPVRWAKQKDKAETTWGHGTPKAGLIAGRGGKPEPYSNVSSFLFSDVPWLYDSEKEADEENRAATLLGALVGQLLGGDLEGVAPLVVQDRSVDAPANSGKVIAVQFSRYLPYQLGENPEDPVPAEGLLLLICDRRESKELMEEESEPHDLACFVELALQRYLALRVLEAGGKAKKMEGQLLFWRGQLHNDKNSVTATRENLKSFLNTMPETDPHSSAGEEGAADLRRLIEDARDRLTAIHTTWDKLNALEFDRYTVLPIDFDYSLCSAVSRAAGLRAVWEQRDASRPAINLAPSASEDDTGGRNPTPELLQLRRKLELSIIEYLADQIVDGQSAVGAGVADRNAVLNSVSVRLDPDLLLMSKDYRVQVASTILSVNEAKRLFWLGDEPSGVRPELKLTTSIFETLFDNALDAVICVGQNFLEQGLPAPPLMLRVHSVLSGSRIEGDSRKPTLKVVVENTCFVPEQGVLDRLNGETDVEKPTDGNRPHMPNTFPTKPRGKQSSGSGVAIVKNQLSSQFGTGCGVRYECQGLGQTLESDKGSGELGIIRASVALHCPPKTEHERRSADRLLLRGRQEEEWIKTLGSLKDLTGVPTVVWVEDGGEERARLRSLAENSKELRPGATHEFFDATESALQEVDSRLSEDCPVLVITDLGLPKHSGHEPARKFGLDFVKQLQKKFVYVMVRSGTPPTTLELPGGCHPLGTSEYHDQDLVQLVNRFIAAQEERIAGTQRGGTN